MRSTFLLLALALTLVGCSDPAVDAVKDIYKERAVFGESDAQYDARQKPASLVLPLVEEDDAYTPKLRWAAYNANASALDIIVDVGPAPMAKLHVAKYKRPGSGEFGRRANYWMHAANVPAPNNAWSGKSVLASGPNVRDTLNHLEWVLDYTPASHAGDTYSDEEETHVNILLHRVSLVDKKSKKVYWEKTFEDSATKMACDPPQSGTWSLDEGNHVITMSANEKESSPLWRNISLTTSSTTYISRARLTSFDTAEGSVRFVMDHAYLQNNKDWTIDWVCTEPAGFVVTTRK